MDENSVCAKYAQTADDGKNYNYKFYSLAAIIAVGYRTNSDKATQFRQWATKVLDAFTKQGYVLDTSINMFIVFYSLQLIEGNRKLFHIIKP